MVNGKHGHAESHVFEAGVRSDDVLIVAFFDRRKLKHPAMLAQTAIQAAERQDSNKEKYIRPELLQIMPPGANASTERQRKIQGHNAPGNVLSKAKLSFLLAKLSLMQTDFDFSRVQGPRAVPTMFDPDPNQKVPSFTRAERDYIGNWMLYYRVLGFTMLIL